MPSKLTKTAIDRLEPRTSAYEVADSEIAGLLLRVQPSGQKSWYLRYRLPTGRRRLAMGLYPGLTPDGARTVAKRLIGDVAAGVDVQDRKDKAREESRQREQSVLGRFVEQTYGPWCLAHLKAGKAELDRLAADFKHLWDTPMSAITPARIDDWRRSERERGVTPRTINRNVCRIRSALSRAVQWGVLEVHPFAQLKPLRYDKTLRVRYLSSDQEDRLFEALEDRERDMRAERVRFNEWLSARSRPALPEYPAPYADYLRPLVLFVRHTGLRRGEALGTRWADVDLEHRVVTVRGSRAKSQQTRRVPLNSTIVAAMTEWQRQRAPKDSMEYVFGQDPSGRQLRVDKAWKGVLRRAGLEGFRFHDLRHHFASRLVQRGTDLNTVRELLGHSSIDMTLGYAHLAPDGLAAAVERIA
jgi:integrase